jgi:hypothetical protein
MQKRPPSGGRFMISFFTPGTGNAALFVAGRQQPRKTSPAGELPNVRLQLSVPGESPQQDAAPPKAKSPVTAQAHELART